MWLQVGILICAKAITGRRFQSRLEVWMCLWFCASLNCRSS